MGLSVLSLTNADTDKMPDSPSKSEAMKLMSKMDTSDVIIRLAAPKISEIVQEAADVAMALKQVTTMLSED